MQINPFVVPLPADIKSEKNKGASPGFKDLVQNALDKVNRQQLQAQEATRQFISGDLEDIHQLMIAVTSPYLPAVNGAGDEQNY